MQVLYCQSPGDGGNWTNSGHHPSRWKIEQQMITDSRTGKNKESNKNRALSCAPRGGWRTHSDQVWGSNGHTAITICPKNGHLKAHYLAPFSPGVDGFRGENKNKSPKWVLWAPLPSSLASSGLIHFPRHLWSCFVSDQAAKVFLASPDPCERPGKAGAARPEVVWSTQTCLPAAPTAVAHARSLDFPHQSSPPSPHLLWPKFQGFQALGSRLLTMPHLLLPLTGRRWRIRESRSGRTARAADARPDLDAGRCLAPGSAPRHGTRKLQLRLRLQLWRSPFVGGRLWEDLVWLCPWFSNYGLVPHNEHPVPASAPRFSPNTSTSGLSARSA